MDKIERASNLIVSLNKLRKEEIRESDFIKEVCSYFDDVKNYDLSSKDYNFLKYIANVSGIPHFFNILKEFGRMPEVFSYDLNTLSSMLYESTLHTDEDSMLHKYQMNILNQFSSTLSNRFFLSASTSFGKTHLVFEVLKKMEYKNVVLIFPTVALLSENLEKILSGKSFEKFRNTYSIHTLSEVGEIGEKNIFIYTPERFLSFIEKNKFKDFDFVFVDEVYKIDNEYVIDEQVRENERDVAYRLALYYALKHQPDALLAGPYMDFDKPESLNYNASFDNFRRENRIDLIDYNEYEIVNKYYFSVKKKTLSPYNPDFNIQFSSNKKNEMLEEIVRKLVSTNQNVIVYCSKKSGTGGVEYYADKLINTTAIIEHDYSKYIDFVSHIERVYSGKWVLVNALKYGVGIHHGLIPKYIQKEIISLFNSGHLRVLISTTTITEGVNTSAKNLVVMQSKKGSKDLRKFDAKNIAGRAGRFGYHFSGRVIDLSNSFNELINSDDDILKHKNYDITSPKDEIDLFYSGDDYLTKSDVDRKNEIYEIQNDRGIPEEVINQYKVISRLDKIAVYDKICELNNDQLSLIRKLIKTVNVKLNIDYDGMQVILDVIQPIVKNEKLKFMVEYKGQYGNSPSILIHLIYFYLKDGFASSVSYHVRKGKSIDTAIRETSDFIYNTLKYQVVKYLGVFNVMYKYCMAKKLNRDMDSITGIDKLLRKFEYNALTDEGRLASDYGVPSRVLEYYENEHSQQDYISRFDSYELRAFNRVEEVLKRNRDE